MGKYWRSNVRLSKTNSLVILPVSEEQIIRKSGGIYGETRKKTVDNRRKYGTISPAKRDKGGIVEFSAPDSLVRGGFLQRGGSS